MAIQVCQRHFLRAAWAQQPKSHLSGSQMRTFTMTARPGTDSEIIGEDDDEGWSWSPQRGLRAEPLWGVWRWNPESWILLRIWESILPAFSPINAMQMRTSQSACYTYRCQWGCITLMLSPVSAPEKYLSTHCQSLFCVFSLLQYKYLL